MGSASRQALNRARKLDLPRLTAFIAICEAGSLTAAARELGLAQPALTVSLAKLEQMMGVQLVVRDARGVTPTASGLALLHHAYDIVGLSLAAFEAVHPASDTPAGEVAVGLPSSAAAVLALPLVARIAERLPQVRLRLVDSFSGYLWNWLGEGQLDVALVFDHSSAPDIVCEPFAQEDMHLIGSPEALAGIAEVPVRTLADYPLVMPSRLHRIRNALEAHAARHGTTLRVGLEVDAGQHLIRLVRQGQWFSLLAPCAVAPELAEGTLRACRLTPTLPRAICLAQRRMRRHDAAVRAVTEEVLAMSRELILQGDWDARLLDAPAWAQPLRAEAPG